MSHIKAKSRLTLTLTLGGSFTTGYDKPSLDLI